MQYCISTHDNANIQQAYPALRVNWLGSYGKPEVTSTANIGCCKYYAPSACRLYICTMPSLYISLFLTLSHMLQLLS